MRCIVFFLISSVFVAMLSAQQPSPDASDISALRARAEAGDVKAQVAIARAYDGGVGAPESPGQAFAWYAKAAESGDPEAQGALGLMYRIGRGVDKDFTKAMNWYALAAKQGDANALFNLGTLYYNGDGVRVDDVQAFVFFSAAKEMGSKPAVDAVNRMNSEMSPSRIIQAKLELAKMAARGDRMPGNVVLAAKLLDEMGSTATPSVHVAIAVIYLTGGALKRDVTMVERHCTAAAAKDYAPALVCMGYLNESGSLGPSREQQALSWYEKAAKKGSPIAAFSLGEMYARGAGMPADLGRAYMYLALAAYFKVEPAGPMAEKVGAKLSKSDRNKWAKKARDENDKHIFHVVDNEDREFPFAFKAELPD